MVTENPDKSLTISSTAVENGPAQNSVVEAVLNGVENGGNSLTNDVSTENGTLSNSDRQPGEWESFEVHYVGRGISTIQATNGHESDSSFVSDSDDDQYDGYEPITMQTLQAHTSDFTNSEEDIFDGVVSENENIDEPPATTPRAENRLFATAVPTYQQNGTHTASKDGLDTRAYSNDIPLDKDRIAEITAAMSGFVLPPYASMPDDAKLLEMMSRKRTNIDMNHAVRGVWLVKVPKYLSELWEANEGTDVGRLRLQQTARGTDVKLLSRPGLNQTLLNKPDSSHLKNVPDEHSFHLNDVKAQNMELLLEDKSALKEDANIRSGTLALEGRVVKRADCTPVSGSASYMKMKIAQIHKNMQPKKTVQILDRAVVTNKPINIHEEDAIRQKQKKEGAKTVRYDRDIVINNLFKAFEKHQYYRLSDLQQLTQQPAGYVKELLQEIAVYNSAPPHKNMWELKPEYRNYAVPNLVLEEADG